MFIDFCKSINSLLGIQIESQRKTHELIISWESGNEMFIFGEKLNL